MHTSPITPCAGILTAFLIGCGSIATSGRVRAHCDTEPGPVVHEVTAALEKADVTPLLKWVKREGEDEIREAFALALKVRDQGAEARKLADRYLAETLVRIHRAGEGAPFAGIQEKAVDPVIALADKALAEGKPDALIADLNSMLAALIREKHARVVEAAKLKDRSVEAGREFVAAYVDYTHHLERVRAALLGKALEQPEADKPEPAPEHPAHGSPSQGGQR